MKNAFHQDIKLLLENNYIIVMVYNIVNNNIFNQKIMLHIIHVKIIVNLGKHVIVQKIDMDIYVIKSI